MLKQGLRFAVVGIANSLMHAAVAVFAHQIGGFNAVESNICGFIIAFLFSFIMNTYWSFERKPSGQFFIRFLTVNLMALTYILVVSALSDNMNWTPITGIMLVVLVLPLISFLTHKYWTYAD
ncbi:MAG: hypothetical protein GKR93_17075 [Gammaproteobacteria bacterium]|nr:hypothetical protein [Gammaproteobacteria bacterium]